MVDKIQRCISAEIASDNRPDNLACGMRELIMLFRGEGPKDSTTAMNAAHAAMLYLFYAAGSAVPEIADDLYALLEAHEAIDLPIQAENALNFIDCLADLIVIYNVAEDVVRFYLRDWEGFSYALPVASRIARAWADGTVALAPWGLGEMHRSTIDDLAPGLAALEPVDV